MTVEIVLTLAGIILIFLGIAGKKINIEAKDIKISGEEQLVTWQRITLTMLGIIFIIISLRPIQSYLQVAMSPKTPTPTLTKTFTPTVANTPFLPTATTIPTETELDVWQDFEESIGCKVSLNGFYFNAADNSPLQWFWGDGTETNGNFPQEHVYENNGRYTIIIRTPTDKTQILNVEVVECQESAITEIPMILTEETVFTPTVTLRNEHYILGVIADRSLPSSDELKESGRIDFIWFIDADKKLETSQDQNGKGNDYNVHLYITDIGWDTSIHTVSDIALKDIVAQRYSEVTYHIDDNYAEVSFPKGFLPQENFIWWLHVSSLNSSDEWKEVTPHQFNSTKQETDF